MRDFFAMGGYGGFVWTAFGVTAAVLAGNLLAARRRARQIRAQLLARLNRRAERRAVQ